MKDLSVAILIDGGFFLKRYFKLYKSSEKHTPDEVAKNLYTLAHRHVGDDNYLYRIFYYDSVPFYKRLHNPIPGKVIDFAKSDQAKFRNEFFEELKKKKKNSFAPWLFARIEKLVNQTKVDKRITQKEYCR